MDRYCVCFSVLEKDCNRCPGKRGSLVSVCCHLKLRDVSCVPSLYLTPLSGGERWLLMTIAIDDAGTLHTFLPIAGKVYFYLGLPCDCSVCTKTLRDDIRAGVWVCVWVLFTSGIVYRFSFTMTAPFVFVFILFLLF